MPQAYTPGLKVTPHVRWQCRRVLPVTGEVLVKAGQQVSARDVVARAQMAGDVTPINLAKQLGVTPGEVAACLKQSVGIAFAAGDVIAEKKGLFGLFASSVTAPTAGTLESVSNVTGQAMLRGSPLAVDVLAYLTGEVIEVLPREGVVIAADVALIQGIFGIGGEAYGPLQLLCDSPDDDLTPERLTANHKGSVVVGGRRVSQAAIRKARELGIAAIIAGGMDDQDLKDILGYDLGVAVTGSERIGLTVILTEGFGEIAMAKRTFELLRHHAGHEAAVNGATQIRAGVIRPEIVIPLDKTAAKEPIAVARPPVLEAGVPVRIIREPDFGRLGVVQGLPSEPRTLESESKARVVAVKLSTGAVVTVPRANVELIEEA